MMNSYQYRNNQIFLRNEFETHGKCEFPYIRKQDICLDNLDLIALSDTKPDDTDENCQKIAHGFLDDYRLIRYYNHPEKYQSRLSQYRALITPDYSVYREMNVWREIEAIAHSRWVGKYWQEKWKKLVIPSVSWSGPHSFDYCFDGIERGSCVAISVIGTRKFKKQFLVGYRAMLSHIEPTAVICLGKPFDEMEGNIIYVPYHYPKERKFKKTNILSTFNMQQLELPLCVQ